MFWILCGILCLLIGLNLILPRFTKRRDSRITFIVGQIGSGKSAYSVKLARRALKRGMSVYATDYISGTCKFDPSWLSDMKCPENSLLIIDEAALRFNSREFAKLSKDIIAYFKKCRHFRNDVILISQTFSDSDKQIRELATDVLFLRKFGYFTFPVRVSGDITIDNEGQPAMKYKIGRWARPFIPALQGKFYNTWEDCSNRSICPSIPWDTPDTSDDSEPLPEASETLSETVVDIPRPSDEVMLEIAKMIH